MKIFLYRGLDFFHFRNCSDPILEKKRKDAKAKKRMSRFEPSNTMGKRHFAVRQITCRALYFGRTTKRFFVMCFLKTHDKGLVCQVCHTFFSPHTAKNFFSLPHLE
jgi:hypothetical protein